MRTRQKASGGGGMAVQRTGSPSALGAAATPILRGTTADAGGANAVADAQRARTRAERSIFRSPIVGVQVGDEPEPRSSRRSSTARVWAPATAIWPSAPGRCALPRSRPSAQFDVADLLRRRPRGAAGRGAAGHAGANPSSAISAQMRGMRRRRRPAPSRRARAAAEPRCSIVMIEPARARRRRRRRRRRRPGGGERRADQPRLGGGAPPPRDPRLWALAAAGSAAAVGRGRNGVLARAIRPAPAAVASLVQRVRRREKGAATSARPARAPRACCLLCATPRAREADRRRRWNGSAAGVTAAGSRATAARR